MEIEGFVHQMRAIQRAGSFGSFAGAIEVILQERLILRIGDLVDDFDGSFLRAQAAQVGNAAFGNDDVDVVGRMVDMGAERNNGADLAVLGQGVREEYGQEAGTCEVTGTTDTVHQAAAADVRTVDVTVRRLREKIEDVPSRPEYILTRRGVGYFMKVYD